MKQLTQSEIRKNGKVYKNVSSPATEGTMKQVTDIVEKDGTFSISTDGGKTYSPAGGAVTSVNGQTGAVTGLATTDEVNKKQNTLTETQLAAVNSGITEAKRTKYDGYEATINQKANSADLAQVATSGSYNALKDKPTIPPAITESVVSGWGFTKNTGTVNSVKMNGKPVTITDGAVDLGTVITSHQSLDSKQDKITSSNKLDASLVSGLAKVATTGSYTDLSNKPTILSEEDVKGIKVNNATNADSAGYVKNSIVCQGVGMNADANYSNFVTYDGSAARSIKFYKYDFQMLDALGSGDAELTLRNTGVTAGTYNSVTVDTKGRVTAGTNTPAIDTSEFVPKSAFSLSGTTLTITV